MSLDYSHLLYEKSLVVFVIDSSDLYKMPFVALSLKKLLDCPQIKEIPVLIVANKQVIVRFYISNMEVYHYAPCANIINRI